MYMLGHHDNSMQFVAPSVIEQTMLKNSIPGLARKWLAGVLTKRDEESSTGLLVMRKLSSILILPIEQHLHFPAPSLMKILRSVSTFTKGLSVTDEHQPVHILIWMALSMLSVGRTLLSVAFDFGSWLFSVQV
jgi:hypothetical protein